jgi:ethanolamine utilization protein EutN
MILAKVLGSVTATEKHPAFVARKLLVVQPLDEKRVPVGKSFLAVDNIASAGKGDTVLVLREGTGVRQLLGDKTLPIRSLIVGIVDTVDA